MDREEMEKERVELKINNPATGTELIFVFNDKESLKNTSILQVKERVEREEGVPIEYQTFHYPPHSHIDNHTKLSAIYSPEENNFNLNLIYNLEGGGDAYLKAGDFVPKVKICCFYCGLDSKWKDGRICCLHCACSIS